MRQLDSPSSSSAPTPAICMRASRPRVLRWASPFRPSWKHSHPKSSGIGDCPLVRSHVQISARTPHRTSSNVRSFSSSQQRRFMLDADSTIYALSTAPGRAAIAVVRVSGPACASVRIFSRLIHISRLYTNNALLRYTGPYALANHSRNRALRRFAPYTTPRIRPPQALFLTRAP